MNWLFQGNILFWEMFWLAWLFFLIFFKRLRFDVRRINLSLRRCRIIETEETEPCFFVEAIDRLLERNDIRQLNLINQPIDEN